ncbi:hypothetical protein BDR04DRAFT_1138411 [Suillus decipiens]|nr:hypothetical protein BDR04DRAFT_1138411 [Suillus decipiens]
MLTGLNIHLHLNSNIALRDIDILSTMYDTLSDRFSPPALSWLSTKLKIGIITAMFPMRHVNVSTTYSTTLLAFILRILLALLVSTFATSFLILIFSGIPLADVTKHSTLLLPVMLVSMVAHTAFYTWKLLNTYQRLLEKHRGLDWFWRHLPPELRPRYPSLEPRLKESRAILLLVRERFILVTILEAHAVFPYGNGSRVLT